MEIIIQQFDKKHLDEAVKLFMDDYSSEDFRYSDQEARNWISSDLESNPELCFEAVDQDGNFLGAQFCYENKHSTTKSIRLDSLHVKPEFRQHGVGKLLMKHVLEFAKINDFKLISLMADETKEFPKNWYEKVGFKPTGWVEYLSDINEINFD